MGLAVLHSVSFAAMWGFLLHFVLDLCVSAALCDFQRRLIKPASCCCTCPVWRIETSASDVLCTTTSIWSVWAAESDTLSFNSNTSHSYIFYIYMNVICSHEYSLMNTGSSLIRGLTVHYTHTVWQGLTAASLVHIVWTEVKRTSF